MSLRPPLVLLLLLGVLPDGLGQGRWSVRHFTSMDGLPQNSVVSMLFEADGHLLLSTEGGLVRFDGSRFRRIPLRGDDGTTGGRTRTLLRLADGTVAVRDARNNIGVLAVNEVVPVDPKVTWMDDVPEITGTVPSQRILARIGDAKRPLVNWHMANTTFLPLAGMEWAVLGENALMIFEDTVLREVHRHNTRAEALLQGPQGLFLLGQMGKALRFDRAAGRFSEVEAPGLPKLYLTPWRWHWRSGEPSGFLSIAHRIWRVSMAGQGDSLTCVPLDLGIPEGESVITVVEEPLHGLIAVGTATDGLYLFQHRPLRTLTAPGASNFYGQALIGEDLLIAVNMDRSAAFHIDGEPYDPVPDPAISSLSLAVDRRNRVLFSHKVGLWRYDPELGRMDTLRNGHMGSPYCFMAEGDSIWVGSLGGVGYLKDDTFHPVSALVGRGWASVPSAFCRDIDGHLLAASCNGLFHLDGSGMASMITEFTGHCPRALARIGDRIFVGTYGDGAYIIDRRGIHHLPLDRKGFLAHVHTFMDDGNGDLWMSTNQGLFRVQLAEIDAWLNDTTRSLYYGRYGTEDGILNPEFNGSCTPGHLVLPDGTASFPSMGGLVWFKPWEVPDPYPTAPIRPLEISVDGEPHALDTALVMPAGHRELKVAFSLLYWGSPNNVQLEYDLDGSGWFPVAEGVWELVLQRLPPGGHHLRIRKVGSEARGDEGALDLEFRVAYPFYLTWWWLSLMVVVLVALFYLAVRWNAGRLHKLNLALERSVQQRTEALQNANSELRHWVEVKETLVSVISHDIVAPLRFIARTSSSAVRERDEQRSAGTLNDIARSSDRLYSHAQNLLNWVKHQQGHLQVRLLHIPLNALVDEIMEVMRLPAESKGLELVNAVSFEDVLRSDRDILSVVIQNLVSNAVAHTVKGGIRVEGEIHGEEYHLIVKDTGTGMPLPMRTWILNASTGQGELPERPKGQGHGLGYLIIKALLPLIGARLEIESTANEGSRVHVVLPLSM
ncbi:MAG TPA: HAMP domain-containing sensor histidine kinase [Flavobacteriales bacterium]